MELNRKRSKVIMLPTEQLSQVVLNTYITSKHNCSKLQFNSVPKFTNEDAKSMGFEYQHLYFTTDDEIKEGDWFITQKNTLCKCIKVDDKYVYSKEAGSMLRISCRKIVATTDKSLTYNAAQSGNKSSSSVLSNCYNMQPLPQPSEAFIQKYCELGGIDEVDIEYLRSSDGHYDENDNWHWKLLAPKIDSHNTITIHPIKDNWNRDEVESLIFNFMKFFANKHKIRFDDGIKVSQWIKENLK